MSAAVTFGGGSLASSSSPSASSSSFCGHATRFSTRLAVKSSFANSWETSTSSSMFTHALNSTCVRPCGGATSATSSGSASSSYLPPDLHLTTSKVMVIVLRLRGNIIFIFIHHKGSTESNNDNTQAQ